MAAIGAPGLHFHDLRHTGNTFAAATGAGIKDLMARMGHDSERAAMIYQHKARGADAAMTSAIDVHIQSEQSTEDDGDDGLAGAQVPAGNGRTDRQVAAHGGRARGRRAMTWAYNLERAKGIGPS